MSTAEFFVTPGYGERNRELFHYSQAVKIGDRIELAGQGGWNDAWEFPESFAEEIAQAFHRYMPGRPPVWTNVGVAALGDPNMRVEIRVTALLPN